MGAARGERLLGGLAARRGRGELGADGPAALADLARGPLGVGERGAAGADVVAHELPADLQRLALQALMQLGRLGLALERPQPRARLALDVERAVEVVLGARELQLGSAAALAVLAQAGRLLDQHAPLARLGGDQRLHATLGDDRVHLLAQARVRHQLEHVGEPAAGARQPVLAVSVAVQAAVDRDLRDPEPERAVGVVEHELDLGAGGGLAPGRTAEDDVLHRLAAHGHRGLLTERPQDRVGDVGLARAVGADDHARPRPELHAGAVRERLEPLDGDRLQVHVAFLMIRGRPPRRRSPPARAARPPARRPSWSARRHARARVRARTRSP